MLGLVMAGTLVVVFAAWTQAGRELEIDRQRMTSLLLAAGVGRGDEVTSAFPHSRMTRYRVPLYFHLLDRPALELGAVVADHYQASADVFPIAWVGNRTRVVGGQRGETWDVTGERTRPLYVVHRAYARFSRERPDPLAEDGRFAVTLLPAAQHP
jgi:hypothetical protein